MSSISIQPYVNSPQQNLQRNKENDKIVKDFDINKELANRTFIKPLPSNGKLIKNDIPTSVSEFFKDIKYDISAFGRAVNGEANDHELGKLNDVGMKLGGLSIAGYLFTKKQTPMTKLFEFVGLTSFFASMQLWPKLFLQVPAKLVHGVNIRQEYEDNYGRKKMFYQDHQFIPWDLYSDKEIDKIGDKLKVPRDIPNRREYIQEKMRKIALQNNTMWMLTAGIATPVMSALMCNALEKPISQILNKRTDEKADNLINNLSTEIKKYDYSENTKQLETLLSENKGKTVTTELIEKLVANLAEDIDPVMKSSIALDLERLMPMDAYNINENTVKNIHNVLNNHFAKSKLSQEELEKIIPGVEQIKSSFAKNNLMGASLKEFSEPTQILLGELNKNIEEYLKSNSDNKIARELNFYKKTLGKAPIHGNETELQKAFKSQQSLELTDDVAEKIKYVSSILNDVKAKCKVFDDFAFNKVGEAPETVLANSWNEISDSIMKSLNFTPEEIKLARINNDASANVLREKFENLSTDKEAFSAFVDNFSKLMENFETKMAPLLNVNGKEPHPYHAAVSTTFDNAGKSLNDTGFWKTANSLRGYNESGETSLKGIYRAFVTDRINGVRYSFYRVLNTAMFYYKIGQGYNLGDLRMHRAAKEDAVELAKTTLISGHTSDTAVKFHQNRNLKPDVNDFSALDVKNGKVINKYFGKVDANELAELSNDNEYFEKVMKLMYGGEIHPDVESKLKNNTQVLNSFAQYRNDSLYHLGSDFYFAKPNHLIDGKRIDTSSLHKFTLMGCAPDQMFNNLFNQSFNNRKWFSMVGKLGAGLVGVTLLSQFFMGRTKDPKKIQQEALK